MSGPRYVHDRATHNRRAAEEVVPFVMECYRPESVIDVGCGTGSWLSVFEDHGCRILGLEGEAVADGLLDIPRACFQVVDLEADVPPPGRFDLAICLEVAEHLTEPAGQRLVGMLTDAADVVLFSAAVPGQGGDNHLNERWPDYWQDLFEARGFACDDGIRWEFWQNDAVDWWYRQNMFIARRSSEKTPRLTRVTHPMLLAKKVRAVEDFYQGKVPLRTGVLVFLRAVKNFLVGR
jgi:SAM-dependent methyltransferase